MFRGNPKITLSRTSPLFLEKLFENEVPEISDGLITIKKVVREPGERAKFCVEKIRVENLSKLKESGFDDQLILK